MTVEDVLLTTSGCRLESGRSDRPRVRHDFEIHKHSRGVTVLLWTCINQKQAAVQSTWLDAFVYLIRSGSMGVKPVISSLVGVVSLSEEVPEGRQKNIDSNAVTDNCSLASQLFVGSKRRVVEKHKGFLLATIHFPVTFRSVRHSCRSPLGEFPRK